MIESFLEIIKDYLPSKNLSNRAYALALTVRLFIPLGVFFTGLYIASNFFGDIAIVQQAGLSKKLIDTPVQTNEESTFRSQAIFGKMVEFREAYPQVYATFVIIPYQASIHSFNYDDVSKNDSVVIPRWELRKNITKSQFTDLTINFNKGIEAFRQKYLPNGGCLHETMQPSAIAVLKKILGVTFDSTHYALCPIKDASRTPGKIYEVGYVFSFYTLPKTANPLSEDDIFFSIKFAALTEEIQRIILAPANTYMS